MSHLSNLAHFAIYLQFLVEENRIELAVQPRLDGSEARMVPDHSVSTTERPDTDVETGRERWT